MSKKSTPESGVYDGYFSVGGGKRVPLEVDLRWLTPFSFEGDGEDESEVFTITGTGKFFKCFFSLFSLALFPPVICSFVC